MRLFVHLLLVPLAVLIALPAPSMARSTRDDTVLRYATSSWDDGERIRVISPGGGRLAGWFSGLEADSILRMRLNRADAPVRIHRSQMEALEETDGHKRHVLLGMGVGFAVGLVIGTGLKDQHTNPDAFLDLSDLYPAIGGMTGAVLGGTAGFFIKSQKWREVASFRPED